MLTYFAQDARFIFQHLLIATWQIHQGIPLLSRSTRNICHGCTSHCTHVASCQFDLYQVYKADLLATRCMSMHRTTQCFALLVTFSRTQPNPLYLRIVDCQIFADLRSNPHEEPSGCILSAVGYVVHASLDAAESSRTPIFNL